MFCFDATLFVVLLNYVFLPQIAMLANAYKNLKARVHSIFAAFPYLVVCERRVSYVFSSFLIGIQEAISPSKSPTSKFPVMLYLLDLTSNTFTSTLVLVTEKLTQAAAPYTDNTYCGKSGGTA